MVEIELARESKPLTTTEIEERSIGGVKIVEQARAIALDLKQRAKLKWEVESDEKSHFFHGYVNKRN